MNLPLVFDIATGLVFTYLILSLLTSEIQELIATLLQWRAEHLKKSIEVMFSGDHVNDQLPEQFTNNLYRSPLIQSLNQEAKGLLSQGSRTVVHKIGDTYRAVTGTRNVFGEQRSGPSYIPGSSFASALLQQLNLDTVSQKVSEVTLKRFSQEKIVPIQELIDALRACRGDDILLENELLFLKRNLTDVYEDLKNRRTTLSLSIETATQQLTQFIDNIEVSLGHDLHYEEIIRQRLPYLRQTIQLKRVEPALPEVMSLILETPQNLPPQLAEAVNQVDKRHLPSRLKQNLMSLAQQAQLKAKGLEYGVRQMEQEVEVWFDHSMERASGVYKRNSKGVALLIGFLVAIVTNTDTFHIIDRLSKDSLLRMTIAQTADNALIQTRSYRPYSSNFDPLDPTYPQSNQTPDTNGSLDPLQPPQEQDPSSPIEEPFRADDFLNPGQPPLDENQPSSPMEDPLQPLFEDDPQYAAIEKDLSRMTSAVDNTLAEFPLPLGWDKVNRRQQAIEDAKWQIPLARQIAGWFVSGVALSMGASFWFDLLSKVMRVRNVGKITNS